MNTSYIQEIARMFDVELILQYGDRIENSADIDLLIVSNDFEGVSTLKRRELIKRIDSSLDPICLTVAQFDRLKVSKSSLFGCIKKTQILLHGSKTALF